MLFSVVIPTYNSGQFIESTIISVLNQTYKDFEIIISDDGSSDNTIEVVKNIFKLHSFESFSILANNHMGPGASRNAGILKAKGKWISFLDSDDKWDNNKLEVTNNFIQKNKSADLVCHSEKTILLDQTSFYYNYYKKFDFEISPFLSLYRQNALSTSAVIVKKSILLEAGMFDVSLPSAQDYDLWLRIALIPQIGISFIKQSLGCYMVRHDNISSNHKNRYICLSTIYSKHAKQLGEHSNTPISDKLNFSYRINKGYCRNLILDKEYLQAIPLLAKLDYLKVWKEVVTLINKF